MVVTIPDAQDFPGEHTGVLRAWPVDDETGDWWAMCRYYVGPGMQLLGWIHQDHMRPVDELTDADGLVDPGKVVAPPHREGRAPQARSLHERYPIAEPLPESRNGPHGNRLV